LVEQEEKRFGLNCREADVGNARSHRRATAKHSGGDVVAERRAQAGHEFVAQAAQSDNLLGSTVDGYPNRSRKGASTRHIRSARASAAFLTTAEKKRIKGDARPNEQGARADWSTQLVTGDRDQVEIGGRVGDIDPTTSLHGIGVKERLGADSPHGLGQSRKIVDRSGLVIDGDHRHNRDVVETGQHLSESIGINPTVAAEGHRYATGVLHGFKYCVVFASRANREPASGTKHASNRQIVSLATTAGEYDLRRGTTVRLCDHVASVIECSSGLACDAVRSGRVGVVLFRCCDPGGARLRPHRGTRCMIKIDLAFGHIVRLGGATPLSIHRQTGTVKGYTASSYGDGFADIYDDWYTDISDIDATVNAVAALADGGAVLELGIGTGRLALPLAERGLAVTGIDASPAMLDALRAKPGANLVELVEADMADPGLAGRSYAVAFAAFNTFFNLTDTAAQESCFAAMSACLQPSGHFAIEGFVPPVDGMSDGGMSVRDITVDRAVLTISQHDSANQTISGQHVDISEAGIRMRPWMMHYRTPDQLDVAASSAGFVLESRTADWQGTSFDSQSETHVSVYRLIDSA